MTKLLVATAMVALGAGPAGAPILCPDPETGVYGPEHCDLIEPIEPNPRAVECEIFDLFAAEQADPVCADYWAREEPGAVLQFLHEQRGHKFVPPED
jgi:hypothetical protein